MAQTSVKRKGWKSLGSEREIAEEGGADYVPRPLVAVQFDAKRELFIKRRTQQNFITKEASEDSRDVRGTQNPLYDTFRMESSTGVQAVKQQSSTSTQTPYFRKVHVCVQAQPTVVDARAPQPADQPVDPKLGKFLARVLPRTLHHLTQNTVVPLFADDYLSLTEEDAFVGSREDNFLHEKGNFNHPLVKGRHITCVDWHSSKLKDDMVVVSSIAPVGLVERVDLQRQCEASVTLVWDLLDPMHPRYLLEAPVEVQVAKFNPSRPNIVVGGLINGQVAMWDLSRAKVSQTAKATRGGRLAPAHQESDVKEIAAMAEPVKGHSVEKDGDATVSRLQPVQLSRVEMSHRHAVHDVCWLPDGLECGFDGRMFSAPDNNQFATISDDGTVCIWDLRPEHLPLDKQRKLKHQSKVAGDDKPWVSLLKFTITRPDGSGDILGYRVRIEGKINGVPSYTMCCTSTDGEFVVCNLAPKDESKPGGAAAGAFAGGAKEAKLVRSITQAHAGPGYSVERHPLISDVYLTVGDWGFKIWRTGLEAPILSSPYQDVHVMCGRWSPTRASVVFVGTSDGKIQAWDLLDRSHEPVLIHQLIQDAVTRVEFKPVPEKRTPSFQQYVVLGTKLGTFHWYALPKVFTKGSSAELRNFRQLLEREVRRVSYFCWRWGEREKELDKTGGKPVVEAPKSAVRKDGLGGEEEDAEEQEFMLDPEADAAFLAEVERLQKLEEEKEKS
jgi:WD40 repeat protein